MTSARTTNLQVATSFLAAYWHADLLGAMAYCRPDSMIELTRTLPILTPAPISVVLPLMFRDVYVRFEQSRFRADIDATIADGERVLVEYTARGTLVTGCAFKCGYAVTFAMLDGFIDRIRAYADTRFLAAPFVEY